MMLQSYRRRFALALLLTAALTPMAAVATMAQDATDPPAPDTGDSRLGVIAAIGCGLFTRAAAIDPQPGIIAGAVACCAFMIFDGLADPDSPSAGR